MKRVSFSAMGVGTGLLMLSILQATTGHPPFALLEAFFLAAIVVILSALGGFEWGFMHLVLLGLTAGVLRGAWESAFGLFVIAGAWYVGATLLAARGSRALMGIAAGALFVGLVFERMTGFTTHQWVVFFALLFLEVSGMYLAGNVLKGRWFSPYA